MERDVLYSSALSPRLPRHIHPHEADDLDNFTAHFTDYYNYQQGEVYILSRPVQCLLILLILLSALVINALVVHNICESDLKLRSVNFLLIQHLCVSDCVGAALVLPAPLLATARGRWDFGSAVCKANSTLNIALWLQHFIMFALLKVDRSMATCLPIGRYPLVPPRFVIVVIVLAWFVSLLSASLVNSFYSAHYEPAVVLCIPNLPVGFFISLFTFYVLALASMVLGYIGVLLHLRRKQRRVNARNGMRIVDYRQHEKTALLSFLITLAHFLLYVPTMLVIGLHGWLLHPVAILACDMIVYCEFLIHPVVLLATSTRMRREITATVRRMAARASGDLGWAVGWCCSIPRGRRYVTKVSNVKELSDDFESEPAAERTVATTIPDDPDSVGAVAKAESTEATCLTPPSSSPTNSTSIVPFSSASPTPPTTSAWSESFSEAEVNRARSAILQEIDDLEKSKQFPATSSSTPMRVNVKSAPSGKSRLFRESTTEKTTGEDGRPSTAVASRAKRRKTETPLLQEGEDQIPLNVLDPATFNADSGDISEIPKLPSGSPTPEELKGVISDDLEMSFSTASLFHSKRSFSLTSSSATTATRPLLDLSSSSGFAGSFQIPKNKASSGKEEEESQEKTEAGSGAKPDEDDCEVVDLVSGREKRRRKSVGDSVGNPGSKFHRMRSIQGKETFL